MLMFERLLSILAPHMCLGCGAESNQLVCVPCSKTMERATSHCYRCKAVTRAFEVCDACRGQSAVTRVVVYTRHGGLAKELIHHAKYERAQAGFREMARMLASLLEDLPRSAVLTYVPTASTRVRVRGYDHAQLLARELARSTGMRMTPFLARTGQAHQVGANRARRLAQLHGAFRPIRGTHLRGTHVLLVDDVMTTGATLELAARELRGAGAASVSAIVFAQA